MKTPDTSIGKGDGAIVTRPFTPDKASLDTNGNGANGHDNKGTSISELPPFAPDATKPNGTNGNGHRKEHSSALVFPIDRRGVVSLPTSGEFVIPFRPQWREGTLNERLPEGTQLVSTLLAEKGPNGLFKQLGIDTPTATKTIERGPLTIGATEGGVLVLTRSLGKKGEETIDTRSFAYAAVRKHEGGRVDLISPLARGANGNETVTVVTFGERKTTQFRTLKADQDGLSAGDAATIAIARQLGTRSLHTDQAQIEREENGEEKRGLPRDINALPAVKMSLSELAEVTGDLAEQGRVAFFKAVGPDFSAAHAEGDVREAAVLAANKKEEAALKTINAGRTALAEARAAKAAARAS